jgi:hypothetical protein
LRVFDKPVADVEQLTHCGQGVELHHRLVAVNGLVAELHDEPRLGEHGLARGVLEGGLVDEGAEVVLVGQPQGWVVSEDPVDGEFQGTTRIEARGTRV